MVANGHDRDPTVAYIPVNRSRRHGKMRGELRLSEQALWKRLFGARSRDRGRLSRTNARGAREKHVSLSQQLVPLGFERVRILEIPSGRRNTNLWERGTA